MKQPSARMIYLHALTPIHSGTGQAAAVIDLPILREKTTGWPILPASSLKGVVRDALTSDLNANQIEEAFGDVTRAGAFCFADQRLLCFPVRSYYGTFAYVTCNLALQRFRRDCDAADVNPLFTGVPDEPDDATALVSQGSKLAHNGTILFEDLDLSEQISAQAGEVAAGLAAILFAEQPEGFTRRFTIVSDNIFTYLCETATEVTARVALEPETKTVKGGGLWYEEAVPAEAIFSGPLVNMGRGEIDTTVLEKLREIRTLQIGGKAGIGKGLCRVVMP